MAHAPTRDNCIQVEEVIKELEKGLPFITAMLIGSDAMAGQLHQIQQDIELNIRTLGMLVARFIKHISTIRCGWNICR